MKNTYLKNHPSQESLKLIQESANQIFPDKYDLSEWSNNYLRNHQNRISLDLDMVKDRHTGGSILEFGSVPLLLTLAMKECGYDVTGVDLSPERYATFIEKLDLNIVKCDIEHETLPFEDNSFDFILFNELFEHLRINPIFTLSEVYRVMKPSGRMLLSTPNLRSYNGIRNFILKNKSYSLCGDMYSEYSKLSTIGHMGHVREYTTAEVIQFLGKIGFETLDICYRGSYSGRKEKIRKLFPKLSPFVTYEVKK